MAFENDLVVDFRGSFEIVVKDRTVASHRLDGAGTGYRVLHPRVM